MKSLATEEKKAVVQILMNVSQGNPLAFTIKPIIDKIIHEIESDANPQKESKE